MVDQKVEEFICSQRLGAAGMRRELLQKEMIGERKLLSTILYPVLKTFDGLILEHEIMSQNGVRIYVDAFYEPLGLAFECEGFAVHGEQLTRDRFSFEKMRIRTIGMYGYIFFPFSWDEMDKRHEACQRALYELLGRFGSASEKAYTELTVYEREVLRFGLRFNRPIRLADARYCLGLGEDSCRKVLRKLVDKKLIFPTGTGSIRFHEFELNRSLVLMWLA